MLRVKDRRIVLLLGGCFGGFSIIAFVMFVGIFIKMGIEPRWRQNAASCSPAAERRSGANGIVGVGGVAHGAVLVTGASNPTGTSNSTVVSNPAGAPNPTGASNPTATPNTTGTNITTATSISGGVSNTTAVSDSIRTARAAEASNITNIAEASRAVPAAETAPILQFAALLFPRPDTRGASRPNLDQRAPASTATPTAVMSAAATSVAATPPTAGTSASQAPSAAPTLAAPQLLAPESQALQKQTDSIDFSWSQVPGAARYHLHVWQQFEGDETTLVDNDIEDTQVKVQLVHPTPVQWELQAVDQQGRAGDVTRSTLSKTSR